MALQLDSDAPRCCLFTVALLPPPPSPKSPHHAHDHALALVLGLMAMAMGWGRGLAVDWGSLKWKWLRL